LRDLRKRDPDYETLRPYFLGRPAAIIKRTYENSTQYYRTGVDSTGMKQTFCSPFPALNVHRRNEPVATDTLYADVPVIGTGGHLGCHTQSHHHSPFRIVKHLRQKLTLVWWSY
jgi:hypothetical protein